MAKHRGRRRGRVAPMIMSGAAVVTATAVGGVATTAPGSVAAPAVELAALVVEGSSTNPTGVGIAQFYGGRFIQDETIPVNFFTGPFGVSRALIDTCPDPTTCAAQDNVVLSSGWGAANVSLLLTYLQLTQARDPALTETLYILDNNVARPNGGFGTRYPVFAAIGVNPIPTPEVDGVEVLDIGYEYDINGNTPAYVLNPVAMANSLATYLDNRLNQNDVDLPVTADGDVIYPATCAGCETRVDNGEEVEFQLDTGEIVRVKKVGSTTYISYRTEGLPLLQPVREYGGSAGDRFADAVEPALKAAVDYGYPDNDALANPDRYEPARLAPTPRETVRFAHEFAGGVREGLGALDDDAADESPSRISRLSAKKAAAQVQDPEDDQPAATGKKTMRRSPVSTAIDRTVKKLTKPLRDRTKSTKTSGTASDQKSATDD